MHIVGRDLRMRDNLAFPILHNGQDGGSQNTCSYFFEGREACSDASVF